MNELNKTMCMNLCSVGFCLLLVACSSSDTAQDIVYDTQEHAFPNFSRHQFEVFSDDGAQTNAWGDYDSDGDLDLYVGFTSDPTTHNKLYENQNNGEYFSDVSDSQGMNRSGTTRQPSFIDYDGDGDLDLFTANQNGDEDGFYLNLGNGSFEDGGADLGINQPARTATQGSVGVAVGDYDNDGDLDLYVASYGPDLIWENQNDTLGFIKISSGEGFDGDHHSVAATFADYDNDGWLDLYVGTFISTIAEEPDYLFKNVHGDFHIVTPSLLLEKGTSHGIAWADYDGDGDVDLAVANNHAEGTHTLYRNELGPERARKSLQLAILDNQGRWTRAGATVTLSASTWNHSMEGQPSYVSSRVVDTGGGYSSQGATPVHFGIPSGIELVDLTIRWYENGMNIQTVSNLDHSLYADRIFEIRLHPTP